MSKLRKLIGVRPRDLGSIAKAYYYLAVAGWRLFIRRENLSAWLINPADQPPLSEAEEARMRRAALWANRAARLPFPNARCLQRSLALCLCLEHDGFKPSLQVGARLDGRKLDAHAWVEYRGSVINDRESVKVMFPRLTRQANQTAGTPQ